MPETANVINTSTLDIVVILGYFVGITALGVFFGKFTKSTKDFFFGGQRFSWWMIGMSCVATVVGSYSFIKYSSVGYRFGLSSTMTYLNDWFIVPFFLLGWLPIIYFNRIVSIPEYFAKRFDEKTKIASIVIIMVYMIGYVGINYYTLGKALQPVLQINLYYVIFIVAIFGAIYMHAGGQTSVIMTDIIQGFILIAAGTIMFFLNWKEVGSLSTFWNNLPPEHKLPFSGYNTPAGFNHVGIFWQDAAASSVAFWFMSQGTIMRFLSAKSPREGRKAMFFIILVLMPLAAFALANTGWFGRAMVELDMIKAPKDAANIFVTVASKVAGPGLFGFILAALTAALMSTIDTLINAISAIFVNDIYKPYVNAEREDRHYLTVARIVALVSAGVGLALVPLFASFKSIYAAHGIFIATVTPAMVLVIMLSVFWKRLTPNAAFATLVGGSLIMAAVAIHPPLMTPFAHGIDVENNYKYIRAFFGLVTCGFIAVLFTAFTKKQSDSQLSGLVIDSIDQAKRFFKGGETNDDDYGKPVRLKLVGAEVAGVSLASPALESLKAKQGDIVHVSDARWYTGGLKSIQLKITGSHEGAEVAQMSSENMQLAQIEPDSMVKVEKII